MSYESHPGFDSQGCRLQYTVVPAMYASSRPGFGCWATGGHCVPGDHCAGRLERIEGDAREEMGGTYAVLVNKQFNVKAYP